MRTPFERPNILLIVLDQMRWDAIAAHGNPIVRTPHMNRLVSSGMTFRRAYTHSPVCVPARATLMTGLLPHRSGVISNDTPLRDGATTFPRLLRSAGYATHAVGKMHFQPPRASHGIDHLVLSEEIPNSLAHDDFLQDLHRAGYSHVEEPHGVRHELYYMPQPSQLPEQVHTTAWTGRRTCEVLAACAERPEVPFFCWTSFIKPHPPFDPPAPWYRMYDPLEMPEPVRDAAELGRLGHHQRLQHRVKWTQPALDVSRERTLKAFYYASVSFVDAWIGQIIDELERLGLRENTVILLTSDHGEYLGDHWTYGKRGYHDAAARVPLVMSWPHAVDAGRTCDALVGLADVAPTVLDAARVDRDLDVDGTSLISLATGSTTSRRTVLLGQLGAADTAMYLAMNDRLKYIYSAADDREFLWRYASPRDETHDLAAEPSMAGDLAALRSVLIDRFRADGYLEPLDGKEWRHYPAANSTSSPHDRNAEGRGRQYAIWPVSEPWVWSEHAAEAVGRLPSDRERGYSGA